MEIYQIHWPFGRLNAKYWDGLADCVEKGLVKVMTMFLAHATATSKACCASSPGMHGYGRRPYDAPLTKRIVESRYYRLSEDGVLPGKSGAM